MTCDHSKPDIHLLFVVGELFSRAQIPHNIVLLVILGRMATLREMDGARHCGRKGDQAISCKNHGSTAEFTSSRGHSSLPMRIDHPCRV